MELWFVFVGLARYKNTSRVTANTARHSSLPRTSFSHCPWRSPASCIFFSINETLTWFTEMWSHVDETKRNKTANANTSSLTCRPTILVIFNYVWEQKSTQPTNNAAHTSKFQSHRFRWTDLISWMTRTSEQTVKTAFFSYPILNIWQILKCTTTQRKNAPSSMFFIVSTVTLYQPVCVTSQQIATLLWQPSTLP